MVINIQDDILRLRAMGLLERLLQDQATGHNILWATDAYAHLGVGYQRGEEITTVRITGENSDLIKTRARRAMEQQSDRTKQHAEVFTPLWIVEKMNDFADEQWFGRKTGIHKLTDEGKIYFAKDKNWKRYAKARRLEITCGEAPFLATRYDVETGEALPVEDRIGLLDRKLRAVSENAADINEWKEWALIAAQSIYGYELQGDNLLIARVNILCTLEEHFTHRWKQKADKLWMEKLCRIISWNLWQMDGIKGCVPLSPVPTEEQLTLFPSTYEQENLFGEIDHPPTPCCIYNWLGHRIIPYPTLREKGSEVMKFDFIIGNPPYQEAYEGQSSGANSIYDKFMDGAFEISSRVELITPGRFLFNAGSTPKAWNAKMLTDPHFMVIHYESVASNFFPNVIITGGVAITYRDAAKMFGAIETFTAFEQLNSIMQKIKKADDFSPISEIAVTSFAYHFTKKMHDDHPEAAELMSKGHAFDLKSNCFETLSHIFTVEKQNENDACVLGRDKNGRALRYIKREYINDVVNFEKFKVFLSKADGASGTIGNPVPARIVGTSAIGHPYMGSTESFLSIGAFETLNEAENLTKYIKTRFARVALGILKVTQDITPSKWKYVPLQDFTPASDIDWSKSVSEIDLQLYAKYGLDETEIEFIESHVKEMV